MATPLPDGQARRTGAREGRPAFSAKHLPAGTRLGLAVSGGADSIALLRLAADMAPAQGWALTVLHVDHGLRGADSRADAVFVEELARDLGLGFRLHTAAGNPAGAGLEAAGRALRYGWFGALLAAGELDAVATGHTLDDQAETVLAKMLRGAWTRGLAGIHPVVAAADLPGTPASARGVVVRPLLETRREELRDWLGVLGQNWRKDASNLDPAFTRNRIRHEILPALRSLAPQVDEALAHTAALARADEEYWQAEVRRLLPGLLLPGRPVRGGGRASSTLGGERSAAFEVERLRGVAPALRSRLLRAAAAQLGCRLGYPETAALLTLCEGLPASTPRRAQLGPSLRAERSARELRLVHAGTSKPAESPTVTFPLPGMVEALGVRLTVSLAGPGPAASEATLRAAAPGDRIRLRHSSGAPKRIKEVLERRGVPPGERAGWPVLVYAGEIVWMKGAALEPTSLSRGLLIRESEPGR